MKVNVPWLREFVDVSATAEEVATRMSVRGFAAEGIDGDVIDFEVTGNRPDCMSMLGMAREVATAYDVPLKQAAGSGQPAAEQHRDLRVVIETADLCPRYVGAVADVTVGPSPAWMQERLQAAGIRPISNIVDITNYVLLELGQPMHAFDHAKVAGAEIRVRTARSGERLRTLDGQVRELSLEMLVIADAERATAVAGVMGGGDSEVGHATKTIVLESAYFNPLSVRRTSRKLGLKTEASMRFERGTDPNMPARAMARAIELLEQIGAGRARGPIVDAYPNRHEPRVLRLRRARVRGLLGTDVPEADVQRILASLGFALVASTDGWDVTVPTRRVDVLREVDLIEEIARHYGFDKLGSTFPALAAAPPPPDPRLGRARRLRHVMTALGFSEAVTFGFTSAAAAAPFAREGEIVAIKNPLSEAFAVLRPSLLPGLIESAGRNVRRQRTDVRLFEEGNRFVAPRGESRALAFAWAGAGRPGHWSEKPRDVDFFDAKAVVSNIALAHGVDVQLATLAPAPGFLVAGRAAAVMARGARIGIVGQLHPDAGEQLGLPAAVPAYVAELDLEALAASESSTLKVAPLPRFPSVVRDISILVADTLAADAIRGTIRAAAPDTLEDLQEFDRYQGKGIPDGRVSLSLRLTFRAADRTLTDAEVQHAMDAILAALVARHAAVQR